METQIATLLKQSPEVKAALALLEARFERDREEQDIPGLTAMLVYDQEVLWAKGFGYADREEEIPATEHTIYDVGSITKPFTATMLMQLRDQGMLQLDDALSKYLPDFRLRSRFGDLPPVTLRQLASHTAGLPHAPPLELKSAPTETILSSLGTLEISVPPLTMVKYSNLGFGLLGHAASLVAGQKYEDYVQQHILRPLEMNDSGFELTDEMQANMATGHELEPGSYPKTLVAVPHSHHDNLMVAAGGLRSCVNDMARFISLQFRDENQPAGGSQVLRGSTIREMHSVQWMNADWQSGQGIGFFVFRRGEATAIGHGGGVVGFETDIRLVPKTKLGVAVFTNSGACAGAQHFTRTALDLMGPVVERSGLVQERAEPAASPTEWQKYVGLYGTDGEIKLAQNRLVLSFSQHRPPVQLSPEGEGKFRMIGSGNLAGELLIFDEDNKGKVRGLRAGSAFELVRREF